MSKVMRTHTGITEWNGDYWCDSCKRRIPQVRTVDGMDFCPKCYQETFGETDKDKKIADLEAKLAESEIRIKDLEFENKNLTHSLKVAPNALAGQRKRIIELKEINHKLKQQLAEHNEYFDSFNCKDFNEFQDFISTFMLTPHEEQTLIQELKQQLAEKEKDLEEINREFVQSTHDWKEIVDEKIKAKTEFAIQQLQRVKEVCENPKYQVDYEYYTDCWDTAVDKDYLFIEIDQIIKELEGGCEKKEV